MAEGAAYLVPIPNHTHTHTHTHTKTVTRMPVSLSTVVSQQFPANLHDYNHVTIVVRLLLW